MADFFTTRLNRHQKQMQRYLRYVLNDHFVIACTFLLGGLGLYYSDLIKQLPKGFVWGGVLVALAMLAILFAGSFVSLTKSADLVFLLPKEQEMTGYLKKALNYSAIFPFAVIFLVTGLLMPLYVVSRNGSFTDFFWFVVMLWALKYSHLLVLKDRLYFGFEKRKLSQIWLVLAVISILAGLYLGVPALGAVLGLATAVLFRVLTKEAPGALNWQKMVAQENTRLHRIYQFINLFTDVPSITASVKRRKFMDGFLEKIKLNQSNTYLYLYARRIIRGSEYSGLYLRLTGLGAVLLFFINQKWFSLGVGCLFIYLIGFQLVPVYNQFQYMVLTHLYPVAPEQKGQALKKIILVMLLVTSFVFGVISWVALKDVLAGLLVFAAYLLVSLVFSYWYLPLRLKKLDSAY